MMNLIDQFTIHRGTMALLPYDSSEGRLWTFVVDEDRVRTVKMSPLEVIKNSCSYYGSTYSGRKRGAASMGYKSMPPICVCSELNIYFFPLMSEANRECIWLAHSHIRQWEVVDNSTIQVLLTHNQPLRIPVHQSVFVKKVFRTAQYRHQLCERVSPYEYTPTPQVPHEKNSLKNLVINERGTYSLKHDPSD
ncbi:competence transcription factor (CTF) [Sporolactobacillus sp. THM7-4]|nr:competence transcription factor (CTF) [Sporolactobacillus sp. THM7-4]